MNVSSEMGYSLTGIDVGNSATALLPHVPIALIRTMNAVTRWETTGASMLQRPRGIVIQAIIAVS